MWRSRRRGEKTKRFFTQAAKNAKGDGKSVVCAAVVSRGEADLNIAGEEYWLAWGGKRSYFTPPLVAPIAQLDRASDYGSEG